MKRILVVDDAATVRMYHRSLLQGAGWEVDEAMNGIEAMEKALTRPYDLYVVDVNMPKLDGYAFLQRLRASELPQAPAIMVSTEAKANDRERAYAAGANFYVVKPTRPQSMLQYVSLLLGEEACA